MDQSKDTKIWDILDTTVDRVFGVVLGGKPVDFWLFYAYRVGRRLGCVDRIVPSSFLSSFVYSLI